MIVSCFKYKLKENVGGLLGEGRGGGGAKGMLGQRVCWTPISNYWGACTPPPPPHTHPLPTPMLFVFSAIATTSTILLAGERHVLCMERGGGRRGQLRKQELVYGQVFLQTRRVARLQTEFSTCTFSLPVSSDFLWAARRRWHT